MPALLNVPEYLCPHCGDLGEIAYPFCAHCGALSPVFLEPGNCAIDLPATPSAKTRALLVRRLAAWFPQLDPMELEGRLQKDNVRIIEGVAGEDAGRMAAALVALKVPARVAPSDRTWSQILWNPGLLVAAAVLPVLFFVGIAGKALLIAAAGAAVALGAFFKSKAFTPMIGAAPLRVDSEEWRTLARRYAAVITQARAEDAQSLKALTTAAFHVVKRLSGSSLTAAAAGYDGGELHDKVFESLRAAVGLAERLIATDPEEAKRLSNELNNFREALTETSDWMTARENGRQGVLEAEPDQLARIRARVDEALRETRQSPTSERLPQATHERRLD